MSTRAPPPSEALHNHVLHSLLRSSEEDCKEQINHIFSTLSDTQRQVHGISHVEDLGNRLRNYPRLFNISTDGVTALPSVSPTTTLTVCAAHSARAGSCSKRACAELHICCFFLLSGMCPYGKGCHFGHKLYTGHNKRLLKKHRLIGLEIPEIRKLFCLARQGITCPKVCRFYNIATECDKGADCNFIHLCKYFVTGQCKFKSCKRNHNIEDFQVRKVLELYGIQWRGRRVADILRQMNSSASIQGPKEISGIDNSSRDGFSPDTYGTDISSNSDSSEEGEIREDCIQSPNSSEDDRNDRPQLVPSMLKGIRESPEEPGASRWEIEAPHMFSSGEDRNRRRESAMPSRLSPDDNMRRRSSPWMYQDNQRRNDSPQMLSYPEDSSPFCEYGDNSRGYNSPEMLARERDDPTISTRRFGWQQESVQRRFPSPRLSEYSRRSNSPHLAINRKRSNSSHLAINRKRYNSPHTSDFRRYETPPVSEAKKRRKISMPPIGDNWESDLQHLETDTGRYGKKRGRSTQELSDSEDSERMFNHPETYRRRLDISNHPQEDRIYRSSPTSTLPVYERRHDSPQTSRYAAENEIRHHMFQEKNQGRHKVERENEIRNHIFQEKNQGRHRAERISKKRHIHISPSRKRPYQRPGTLGRRPVSKPRKSSSSRQRHGNKMDWKNDY